MSDDTIIVQTSAPTVSLLTRSEVKNYLKIGSDTTDDTLVDILIETATSIIEKECGGLAICNQTWQQKQKGGDETIELLRQPVVGVPTVSYYSSFSTVTATNITYSDYFRVVGNELYHKNGEFVEGRDGDGYIITYQAGLVDGSDYTTSTKPELKPLKTAMLRTIAFLYENREEYVMSISEGEWKVNYENELPLGIKRLIMPIHTGKGLI